MLEIKRRQPEVDVNQNYLIKIEKLYKDLVDISHLVLVNRCDR